MSRPFKGEEVHRFQVTLGKDLMYYAKKAGRGHVQNGIKWVLTQHKAQTELHAEMEQDLRDSTLTSWENEI
jgi:hypothetical protein